MQAQLQLTCRTRLKAINVSSHVSTYSFTGTYSGLLGSTGSSSSARGAMGDSTGAGHLNERWKNVTAGFEQKQLSETKNIPVNNQSNANLKSAKWIDRTSDELQISMHTVWRCSLPFSRCLSVSKHVCWKSSSTLKDLFLNSSSFKTLIFKFKHFQARSAMNPVTWVGMKIVQKRMA